MEETSKTWFYNLPAAKAIQFQGYRHLIVCASCLNQELSQKEVNYNFFENLIFLKFEFSFENVLKIKKKGQWYQRNTKHTKNEVTMTKTAKVTYFIFWTYASAWPCRFAAGKN